MPPRGSSPPSWGRSLCSHQVPSTLLVFLQKASCSLGTLSCATSLSPWVPAAPGGWHCVTPGSWQPSPSLNWWEPLQRHSTWLWNWARYSLHKHPNPTRDVLECHCLPQVPNIRHLQFKCDHSRTAVGYQAANSKSDKSTKQKGDRGP